MNFASLSDRRAEADPRGAAVSDGTRSCFRAVPTSYRMLAALPGARPAGHLGLGGTPVESGVDGEVVVDGRPYTGDAGRPRRRRDRRARRKVGRAGRPPHHPEESWLT
ncbi:hypothetical protein [Amycolatopsis sp.]|uniref:hypothetical protein n=1 Tax=Amycolatopsis sp. TaxID=37632 RepID=UPI002D7EB227|nr:hypothetical protein [Amycolatopsis sp.]HET6703892.1 hypothetical protein [Amycolatopsis sp.]